MKGASHCKVLFIKAPLVATFGTVGGQSWIFLTSWRRLLWIPSTCQLLGRCKTKNEAYYKYHCSVIQFVDVCRMSCRRGLNFWNFKTMNAWPSAAHSQRHPQRTTVPKLADTTWWQSPWADWMRSNWRCQVWEVGGMLLKHQKALS